MRFLYGVLTTLIILSLGGVLFIYSGLFNVAASEDHSALETWMFHTAMHRSVKARAGDVEVPDDLVTEERVRRGARAYDQLCAACHLKPGQSDSLIRKGLNPTPPTLDKEGHWSAGEQFWIIKHGVKMTGMPAWGETHEDEALWELTAFLQRYPSLSEQQYAALVQPDASGAGPADDGHDHEHTNMSAMTGSEPDHDDDAADHHSGDDGHHDQGGEEAGMNEDQGQTDEKAQAAEAGTSQDEDDHYSDGHTH
ncbi:c-type cytochrome [Marinobacter lacisalsi]|uniref:C-type cytochrome n=1 Tax=Marinobacter lacisalsi TaxID=475979 RepID=A0ABV8QIY2_9GAMM